MDLLAEGTYLARPTNWGINEYDGKNGKKLRMFVKFDNGLSWRGYPEGTEGAWNQVAKTLKALGFKGKSLREFVEKSDCIDSNKAVEIVVKHESFVGRDGLQKTVAKVAFVGGNDVDEAMLKRLEQFTIDLGEEIPF